MKTIKNLTGQAIILEHVSIVVPVDAEAEDLILDAHGTLEVTDAKAAEYLLLPNVIEDGV